MNIIFFAHFAGSPDHGMVYGHYFLAREWVKLGHQVTIIAASFAHTRFVQPIQSKKIQEQYIDGIKYIWIPTPVYKPEKWFGRILSILAYTFKIKYLKLPLENVDIVICSSHFPSPIYTARRYAIRFKAKLVFEVRDIWPLTLTELGSVSKKNPFIVWLQRAENYAYQHADKVVSVLPVAKSHMIAHGMNENKFVYIPNGVDLESSTNRAPLPSEHLNRLMTFHENKKIIIGYAGRVGLANVLHVLIEALALCNDPEIGIAILGDGSHLEEIKKLAQKLGITENILFLAPVKKNQVQHFLSGIDVAFIGLQKQSIFRFGVSPTKLNDFMLASKPIIYAIDTPYNIVEISDAGFSCSPEDSVALCKLLNKIKRTDPLSLQKMGQRGHDWIRANHSYEVLAKKFIDALNQ